MNKFSKLCVTGFSISVLAWVSILIFFLYYKLDVFGYESGILAIVAEASLVLGFICPIAGLVVSIIGVVKAPKKRLKGLPFGIIGIVLSAISIVLVILGGLWLMFWLTFILVLAGITSSGSSESTGPRYDVPETESPWTTVETEIEDTLTEDDELDSHYITYGTGPEKIELWSCSSEVPQLLSYYFWDNPNFGDKYTVECTVIDNDFDHEYEKALDRALVNGNKQAPDIYVAKADFVYKYSQGEMAEYASTYRDLGIDVDKEIEEAGIAPYTVEIGSRDGEVIALGFEGTGCAMIYNAEIARDAFGTDDPAEIEKITGAGSGSWDKFLGAAEILKSKGYAAVSGSSDIWQLYATTTDSAWVTDGQLNISTARENYIDLAKTLKDNDYSNNNGSWYNEWYDDMCGEGNRKVFAFFGPVWLINYVMKGNSGGDYVGEGTYGQWRVCRPPVGSYWGGSWIFANKDTDQKKGVAKLIEWITLDTSETGLQYRLAVGYQDGVASAVVMAKANGVCDFCGGQNIYETYIECNKMPSGENLTKNDVLINSYYKQAVDMYVNGDLTRDEAIEYFKNSVYDNVDI